MSLIERWPIGAELPAKAHTVSLDTLRAYAAASGDHNPIHTDAEFAAGTPFGRPIAHGMLLLAYVMEMLTTTFGEQWVESGKLKARFRNPAYVDSTVRAWGSVKKVDEETCRVQFSVGCRDDQGNDLVTGTAEVVLSD
jgi:3-hydroxybutyryl-CoA dehydratase